MKIVSISGLQLQFDSTSVNGEEELIQEMVKTINEELEKKYKSLSPTLSVSKESETTVIELANEKVYVQQR